MSELDDMLDQEDVATQRRWCDKLSITHPAIYKEVRQKCLAWKEGSKWPNIKAKSKISEIMRAYITKETKVVVGATAFRDWFEPLEESSEP